MEAVVAMIIASIRVQSANAVAEMFKLRQTKHNLAFKSSIAVCDPDTKGKRATEGKRVKVNV